MSMFEFNGNNYDKFLFKPNSIEPYPIQRIKWLEYLLPNTKSIFSKIKQNNLNNINNRNYKELTTFIESHYIIEDSLKDDKSNFMSFHHKYDANNEAEDVWLEFVTSCSYNITIMYNWNLYKQCYKFDKDLLQLLVKETDTDKLPLDIILNNMPYPAFFIDNIFTSELKNKEFRGCFISLNYDAKNRPELAIFFIDNTPRSDYVYFLVPLYLGNLSIAELINKRNEIYNVNVTPIDLDIIVELVSKAINSIIYICSSNKEIETITIKNSNNNNVNHKSKAKKKTKKSSMIYQNFVGYKIGNTIRKTKRIYIKDDIDIKDNLIEVNKHNSTKSPHLRKAHYHHFWTGPKNEPEKRKLILKFIPPLYIHSENNNDNIAVTLHKVK